MDFFQRQEWARRNSRRLVGLFALAVAGIVLAVNLVVATLIRIGAGHASLAPDTHWVMANREVFLAVTLATLALVALSALFKIATLKAGGQVVAESMGGTLVSPDTRDPQLRRLRNVVEEMSIASAVPVPAVYVLEHESAINAFAAGFTPSDAAVAVTRGTLEQLNRDELQGVVAHEFSHILNGDMRLNLKLVGVLFGILSIAQLGRIILRGTRHGRVRSSDRKGGAAAILVLGVSLLVIGYIGVFFGRLIKAGISRQREYLADASAVQFTRQNRGIAGALKKIGGYTGGSRLKAAATEEVSHMLFANGLRSLSGWISTHPPLVARIQALDPGFKGDFAAATAGTGPSPAPGAAGLAGTGARPLSADTVADLAGNPAQEQVNTAAKLIRDMGESLLEDLHSPTVAPRVVLGLFLHEEQAKRKSQEALLVRRLGESSTADVTAARDAIEGLPSQFRLPILELAFPALRQLKPQENRFYLDLAHELVIQDDEQSLHEFALFKVLETYVLDLERPRRPARRRLKRRAVVAAADRLFLLLAQAGSIDSEQAARALATARTQFLGREEPVDAAAVESAGLDPGEALSYLDQLPPDLKRRLVQALTTLVLHDGRQEVGEVELLRCFAAALHVPLPPGALAAE